MMTQMKRDKPPRDASIDINKPVSRRTALRALYVIGYLAALNENLHYLENFKIMFKVARDHKNWTTDNWKSVI